MKRKRTLRQRRGTAALPQPNPVGLRCRAAFKPKTNGRAELLLRQRRGTAALPQPNPAGLRCRAAIKPKTTGRAELPLRQRRGTAALPQPNPVGLRCRAAFKPKTNGRAELPLPPAAGHRRPATTKSGRAALPRSPNIRAAQQCPPCRKVKIFLSH
ncbi:MAG: hypothetical protein ACLQUR_01475 [Limisphaerales bacterium]